MTAMYISNMFMCASLLVLLNYASCCTKSPMCKRVWGTSHQGSDVESVWFV